MFSSVRGRVWTFQVKLEVSRKTECIRKGPFLPIRKGPNPEESHLANPEGPIFAYTDGP